MAVLAKIRERSMFLIIIIGLALFAFVLDPSTLGDFFNSTKVNEIGEINGESISRQAFASELEVYKQQVGNRVSEMQASKNVWENIVRKKIYQNQLSEAGVTVGESDVWDEVINSASVKDNPQFKNEIGVFDELKFKKFLADTKENNSQMWAAWSGYLNNVRDNAEKNTYNNLVTAGLGASLKEGEFQYFSDNTKLTTQFVFVPYTSIADSLVTVTKSEISSYIKENAINFKVDETRDISYVKFDITPTSSDENKIKEEVSGFIEDLKTSSNEKEFLSENDSDSDLDENYKFENSINKMMSSDIFKGSKGAVFGPYKNIDSYQISRLLDRKKNGSIRASNIVVAYQGATGASADITRTKEQARRLANNYLRQSRRDPSRVETLALKFSDDPTKTSAGDLGFFQEGAIPQEFFDYANKARIGSVGLVETDYGFHVVKVTDKQDLVLLATVSQKIVPSEKTSNEIFQAATQFEMGTAKQDFAALASAENYNLRTVNSIDALDENLPGLPNQRSIVQWAFGEDASVGDVKRFSLSYGGYAIVKLTSKKDKGLADVEEVRAEVSQIIRNEKKAAMLVKANKGNTSLEDLAAANKVEVVSALSVNQKSATLVGAGNEPYVVGAAFAMEANETSDLIVGNKGVYMIQVTAKNIVDDLEDYTSFANTLAQQERQKVARLVMDALESSATITDNRSLYY